MKSLNNRLSKAESNINRLEKEIKEIDLELQVNYDQTVADPKFFDSYQALKTELKDWNQKWESLYEEIESFS